MAGTNAADDPGGAVAWVAKAWLRCRLGRVSPASQGRPPPASSARVESTQVRFVLVYQSSPKQHYVFIAWVPGPPCQSLPGRLPRPPASPPGPPGQAQCQLWITARAGWPGLRHPGHCAARVVRHVSASLCLPSPLPCQGCGPGLESSCLGLPGTAARPPARPVRPPTLLQPVVRMARPSPPSPLCFFTGTAAQPCCQVTCRQLGSLTGPTTSWPPWRGWGVSQWGGAGP